MTIDYQFVNQLIERQPRWESGAQGPDAFDCWNLVRYIYREQLGIDLPVIPVDASNLRAVVKTIRSTPARFSWQRIDAPEEGCLVEFVRSSHPDHVGIYLAADGGGILHCARKIGVSFDSLPALKAAGWGRFRYYRHIGGAAA